MIAYNNVLLIDTQFNFREKSKRRIKIKVYRINVHCKYVTNTFW